MEKEWSQMTKEEKRDKRMKDYLEGTGIKFRDAKAKKLYQERVTRMMKVSRCEEPDRVPVMLPTGNYPAYYAGYNFKTVMYDAKALKTAWRKFMEDFYEDMDSFMGPGFTFSGKVMDICDFKNYSWPGHGLGDDVSTFQFIEAQYMKGDEYDLLMKDPSDFGFRVLTPRTMGAAAGLQYFPPLNTMMGTPMVMAIPLPVKRSGIALKSLLPPARRWSSGRKSWRRPAMRLSKPASRRAGEVWASRLSMLSGTSCGARRASPSICSASRSSSWNVST